MLEKLKNLIAAVYIFAFVMEINAQEFVKVNGTQFYLNGSEYNFLGFNAYYLLTETAFGRSFIADEVYDAANEIKAEVIRTWAFYEDDGLTNPAVIRTSPYHYNEEALKALDYVVAKAKEKNIRLILTLANNNPHYGGIDQYLRWLKKYNQRDLPHSAFFTDDTLKNWYKEYLTILLERVNTITGTAYKDEPAIFAFELLNEGTNRSGSAAVLAAWYSEMAAYFKSIDDNHLLSTGEAGEDDDWTPYSDVNLFYNSSKFLFDGTKGTSYSQNIMISGLDYGSFHLYSDGYRFHPAAGINWIKEHMFLSEAMGKPSLLGEFGSRERKPEVYKMWLDEAATLNSRSAVVWHYLHPEVENYDGYGFSMKDTSIISVLKNFAAEIKRPLLKPVIPVNAELFQNYPNPFNPVTTIKYALDTDDIVLLELYTSLGERVGVLDEGFRKKGTYEILLSFNSGLLASGTYLYTLRTSKGQLTKKLLLLK